MLVMDFLEKLPIFHGLTMRDRRRISELHHTFIRFCADEVIIREMSKGSSFYILVQGSVRITKNEVPKKVLARLKAGTIFGEIAYLNGTPRNSNVIADSDDVIVMQLDKKTMEQLDPIIREKIKDSLIQLLAARLNRLNEALLRVGNSG